MRTLEQLIQEAIKNLHKEYPESDWSLMYQPLHDSPERVSMKELEDFLKTELTNIVKESFKNTRVEEKEETFGTGKALFQSNQDIGYNQALSDKHNKEKTFYEN